MPHLDPTRLPFRDYGLRFSLEHKTNQPTKLKMNDTLLLILCADQANVAPTIITVVQRDTF